MTENALTFPKNLAYIPAFLLGLSAESYTILGVFMVLDTVLGVLRVYTIYGGQHVRSYRLTAGIISKLTIIGVPLLIVWGGRGAGLDLSFIAQSSLGMLVLAQLYSILGNMYAIRTRQEVHEFDAVSWVLRKTQVGIERLLRDDKKHPDDDLSTRK